MNTGCTHAGGAEKGNAATDWVLVTGASRGLGLAIARKLLDSGYGVIAASRTQGDELAALMEAFPGRLRYRQLDLALPSQCRELVGAIRAEHGALYGLVNNAAVGLDGVLATMHESQIESMIAVNLTGTIMLTKYACRLMLRQRRGRIVNVSSIIGTTGFSGLSVYAATKAALNGFTKSLARELGRVNITVNAVAPGYLQTDMSEELTDDQLEQIRRRSALQRLTEVAEVADMVEFLVSERAGAITGSILTVDSGATA